MSESTRAFDSVAPSYDDEFETSPAMGRLRRITTGIALRYFKPGGSLLELNCGTGTDALTLAHLGMNIVASDASAAMLREAEKKVTQHNLGTRISLELLSFDDLPSLTGRTFDGVFSNMGGLNCTPTLAPLARTLTTLVRPGGFFVACMLSDFCLWETSAFLFRGRIKDAFRRRTAGGTDTSIHGTTFRAYYHPAAAIEQQFKPMFRKVSLTGLNIFTPPPSSRQAYKVIGGARGLLERLDDAVATLAPFNRVGDHFVIVLERTDV